MQQVGPLAPSESNVEQRQTPASIARPPRGLHWLVPLALFGAALLLFAITCWGITVYGEARLARQLIGLPGFAVATLLAIAAGVSGVVYLARGDRDGRGAGAVLLNLLIAFGGLAMAGIGALAALFATYGFSRGRQLRRFGRVLLPPVQESSQWVDASFELPNAANVPLGLGRQWRENGRTEHASVASFARLTLDLMALGAPPALIIAANQDALDEIHHTEACFALAHAIDGQAESPGPFPEAQRAHSLPRLRTLALAELAVLSLVDGALHEGVSARIIAKLARRSTNATIRAILKQIAADEGRHAAHGWDVVEWCLEQGGASVAHALSGAVRALPRQLNSDLPEPARDGAWEAWGIHGQALEREEYSAARADVVQRVQRLIARELSAPRGRAAA